MSSEPAKDRVKELWVKADNLFKSNSLAAAAEAASLVAELLKDEPPGRISTFGYPIHGEAVGLLAYIAYLNNDTERSEKLYQEALAELRRFPETSRVPLGKVLITYASSLMERNRKAEALETFGEAIPVLAAAALNQEDAAFDFLHKLAEKATNFQAWKIAESTLVASIDVAKKSGRPQTELVAYYGSLTNVRLNDRRPADAQEPARESLRLARETSLPPGEVAKAILNLAVVHLELQQYPDVVKLTREATEMAHDEPAILFRARNLEGLAFRGNNPQAAIKVLTGAIDIATRAWGKYSQQTVEARERLANLLSDLDKYRAALPHWEFLKNVREIQFGAGSLEYARALNSYAVAVDQVGQYALADRLYRKALAIIERQLGETDANVLTLRYNLAELARAGGALERSAREFRELEETYRSLGRTETKGFVRVLQNFGLALISLREFPEAREKLEEARTILAKHAGIQSPVYARALLGIAQLDYSSHNYVTAIQNFEQAAAGLRGSEEWIDTLEEAEFGAACATIHVERSDTAVERARTLLDQAIERHGAYEMVIVERSRWLASALLSVHRFSQARETFEKADTGARLQLIEALSSESEKNVRNAVQPMRDSQTVHLSLVFADATVDETGVTNAYEMLVNVRGAETTMLRLRARSSLQSSSSPLQRRVQQLKKEITALELGGDPGGSAAHAEADLESYRKQLESVESQLNDRVNRFRLDMDFIPPALGTIAQALDSDTALVEFASYRRLDTSLDNPLHRPEHYAAFVVRGGIERVQLFDLGPASEINRAIDEFRGAIISQPPRPARPGEVIGWKKPGRALARLILTEPMHNAIAGVKKLVVVPEEKIGLVPLGALPTASGFLMDEIEISYRFSSRNIRRFAYEEDWGVGGDAVVIGAPDYDLQTGAMRSDPLDDENFLSQFRSGQRFEPLKETAAECTDIAQFLGIQPLLAQDATEGTLRALDSPEVLHISTHGFVLDRIERPATDSQVITRAVLEDSMDRSGLAFAGANAFLDGAELPAGAEDGILYASEVTGMNLMRTDLVTLSACQTGLGDVLSGDGVHGLQRAFTAAGARTVVCSLWDVPDKPTRTLFTRFYEEIIVKKRPRSEALQEVIRELAREYPLNPVAWGGFVLYGDVDVLTRYHPVRSLNLASVVFDNRQAPPRSPAQQVEDRIAEGRRLMREGNAAGALEALNSALEVRPVPDTLRAKAMFERAGVLRQSGELQAALAAYDALDQMPDLRERFRADIEIDRGLTYLLDGKRDKAIEHYSAGLGFQGLDLATRASVLVNRGLAHFELNHNEEAIADLNTVINTPGMPRDQRLKAILAKAEIYLGLNQHEEAENEVNKAYAFDLTPDETATATLLLGQTRAAQGKIEEALAVFQKVLREEKIHERYRQIASTLLEHFTEK